MATSIRRAVDCGSACCSTHAAVLPAWIPGGPRNVTDIDHISHGPQRTYSEEALNTSCRSNLVCKRKLWRHDPLPEGKGTALRENGPVFGLIRERPVLEKRQIARILHVPDRRLGRIKVLNGPMNQTGFLELVFPACCQRQSHENWPGAAYSHACVRVKPLEEV